MSAAYISKIRRKQCSMWRLGNRHPGLQLLNLSHGILITDNDVCKLAVAFPNLVELSIGPNPSLTDTCLSSIARTLTQLQSINISGCTKMTDRGIFTIFKLCKNLKTASIANCNFTTKMIEYLKKKGLRIVRPPLVYSERPDAALAGMTPAFQMSHANLISSQVLNQLEQLENVQV